MDDHAFKLPRGATVPRKLAQPRTKNIPVSLRKSITEDLKAQAAAVEASGVDTAFADAAEAIHAAIEENAQPIQSTEELSRKKYRQELFTVITNIADLLRQKEHDTKVMTEEKQKQDPHIDPYVKDPLSHIDPNKLTHAWETKVWEDTYEDSWDLGRYIEHMEQDLADLDIWVTHWDSELDGYEMFREHFYRHFGQALRELCIDQVPKVESNLAPEDIIMLG
ncbi:uncharacterized protein K460DRAFT_355247 [Cucurbitaria berberidis CBS 394.84]|uniref:Uncharacterized protein n=1 Tax=Cucurbitaria berberidis CBS 394.84 TaxID=1168544 RepID=A0A9P4L8M3_9PLEO|nr:uncharacterized protein K460DRAFT_355247 [Cucurbitaria berberidis CBS 394.84]KAF1845423.1 hypothetical protein K460DRAFT_355247 [Cucurbitaria berberidis CBS 394.84]